MVTVWGDVPVQEGVTQSWQGVCLTWGWLIPHRPEERTELAWCLHPAADVGSREQGCVTGSPELCEQPVTHPQYSQFRLQPCSPGAPRESNEVDIPECGRSQPWTVQLGRGLAKRSRVFWGGFYGLNRSPPRSVFGGGWTEGHVGNCWFLR